MRIIYITILLIMSANCFAQDITNHPETGAILDNFLMKYKNCKTFSCEGIITNRQTRFSGPTGNQDIPFTVLYERPFKMWIDWTEQNHMRDYNQHFTLYTLPDKSYATRYQQGLDGHIDRTEKHQSLEDAINRTMRPSYNLTQLIIGFLTGKYNFSIYNVNEVSYQEINKRMCIGLSILQNVEELGQWTIWVDKETYDIRAMSKSGSISASAFKGRTREGIDRNNQQIDSIHEDSISQNDSSEIVLLSVADIVCWNTTIEFTNIIFDEPIESEKFFKYE